MTPERQKWWANLPQREKMLRKKFGRLKAKSHGISIGFNLVVLSLRRQNLLSPE